MLAKRVRCDDERRPRSLVLQTTRVRCTVVNRGGNNGCGYSITVHPAHEGHVGGHGATAGSSSDPCGCYECDSTLHGREDKPTQSPHRCAVPPHASSRQGWRRGGSLCRTVDMLADTATKNAAEEQFKGVIDTVMHDFGADACQVETKK